MFLFINSSVSSLILLLLLSLQNLETYDTEELISIQVQHLEKEKKEMSHRLRVIAKRVDHLERAYRKEEQPLLAEDYEQQQKNDRETFLALQTSRKEEARQTHQEDLAAKARLSRMMPDYLARKEFMISRKGEEYAKKKDAAQRKIAAEKAKRKEAVLQEREEERKRFEEEEKIAREREEEEQRLEEGKFLCRIRPFIYTNVLSLQNVPPKRNVSVQRRKLPPKQPKVPSAK